MPFGKMRQAFIQFHPRLTTVNPDFVLRGKGFRVFKQHTGQVDIVPCVVTKSHRRTALRTKSPFAKCTRCAPRGFCRPTNSRGGKIHPCHIRRTGCFLTRATVTIGNIVGHTVRHKADMATQTTPCLTQILLPLHQYKMPWGTTPTRTHPHYPKTVGTTLRISQNLCHDSKTWI